MSKQVSDWKKQMSDYKKHISDKKNINAVPKFYTKSESTIYVCYKIPQLYQKTGSLLNSTS